MPSVDRILALKLVSDVSSLDKAGRRAESRFKGMARSAASWGKAFTAGLVLDGVNMAADAISNAWDGFVEGERASARLATTWRNLDLEGRSLGPTIDRISALTKRLGTDDVEAINAYNAAVKATGSGGQAMRRLRIALDLVADGSAPNLQSALKLVQQAADGSSRVVKRFGLTSDTAGGRVNELGRKVRGAAKKAAELDPFGVLVNALNEDFEGIVGSLAKGDLQGAIDAMGTIGTDLSAAWDGLAPKIDGSLSNMFGADWEGLKTLVGDAAAPFADLAAAAGPKLAAAWAQLSLAWAAVQPVLATIWTKVQPLVDLFSSTMAGGLGFVIDSVGGALGLFAELLTGDVDGALETVRDTIGNLRDDVSTIIGGIGTMLEGFVPGITTAAGNIGQGILDGIVNIITGLPGQLTDLVVEGVNAIIAAWNELDFYIPAFELPAIDVGFPDTGNGELNAALPRIKGGPWPIFAGTEDLIPNLTPLAKGGIVRHRPGGILAQIGEGIHDEAVVPLDGRGMGGGAPITINLYAAPGVDLASAGRQIVRAIRAYEALDGRSWRTRTA